MKNGSFVNSLNKETISNLKFLQTKSLLLIKFEIRSLVKLDFEPT